MSYIGNSPANIGNYEIVDDISSTFNGVLTSFALTAATQTINPAKSGQLLVSINGVLQEPDDTGTEGFLVSGSNIVFSSAPATGSTFWAVWQGQNVDIGTPSDGVVGTAQMSSAELALTGGLSLGDNVKAKFGDSNDLQIYSDGSHSYIKEWGGGNLRIDASHLTFRDSAANTFISCTDLGTGGQVDLYHLGLSKLATTSTGVDVTGSVTCDGLTVDGNSYVGGGNTFTDSTSGYFFGGNGSYTNGVYGVGTNNVAIAANGSERMRIDSAGRVGIGTASPDATLEINRATNGEYFRAGTDVRGLTFTASSSASFLGAVHTINAPSSQGEYRFQVAGSEKMRITSAGKIHAGYAGTIAMSLGTDYYKGMTGVHLTNGTARGLHIFQHDSDSDGGTNFWRGRPGVAGAAISMKIDSAGKVGIGTTSPDYKLDVSSATGSSYVATFQNTADNLELKIGTVTGGLLNIQGATVNTDTAYNIALQADGGNVGIGMTTPVSKLGVNGTFKIHHANGGTYSNLGTVMGNATNTYIHVKMSRAYWADNGMDMFRITGYKPYGAYVESYMGNYAYGDAGNINSPYGQVNANQGNLAAAANQYYTSEADGRYLVLVLYFPTNYSGLMIEHIQAGTAYGGYNGNNMAILTYVNAANATTKQW